MLHAPVLRAVLPAASPPGAGSDFTPLKRQLRAPLILILILYHGF